jgi:hypothetical protein
MIMLIFLIIGIWLALGIGGVILMNIDPYDNKH